MLRVRVVKKINFSVIMSICSINAFLLGNCYSAENKLKVK